MTAGDRNAFIGIYASTEAAGDAGDPQPSWSDTPAFEVWAFKRNISQREAVISGAVQQDDRVVFEILYLEGITTQHRIKYGEIYFDITGIDNVGERNKQLNLTAREGVSYGS